VSGGRLVPVIVRVAAASRPGHRQVPRLLRWQVRTC